MLDRIRKAALAVYTWLFPPKPVVGSKIQERVSVDLVAKLVLSKNNALIFLDNEVVNPFKGVKIHKIGSPTALAIASELLSETLAQSLPLPYALACLCIESCFDPQCENGNFEGSNKAKDPAGYDMGIAQLKVRYLVGLAGVATTAQARTYALDIRRALPHFVAEMNGLLLFADDLKLSASADPRSKNRYFTATCAYNYGRTGVINVLNSAGPNRHGDHVVNLERSFAKSLGEPSVFADLP